ncbi:hypothetical protein ACIBMZ_29360 [Micromonospora sp. NPDC049900]|uniref:hypothetical protein n=1 Tax=Micromonospora sp. NPDC049900 TaxID=3364275 RepID=UPI0037A4C0FD
MPIPRYVFPYLRRADGPNPFAQTLSPRLRVLVDQPLVSGPVDGQGDYHGYPFIGGGSTGFPDALVVLRSYLVHPALEILRVSDELREVGDVVFGEPGMYDTLAFERKTADGGYYSGVDCYSGAQAEAVELTTRYGIDAADSHDGAVLYRLGNELEADVTVTDRRWLLSERSRPYGKHLANLFSPDEALALIGLFLRWHRHPVIIGGSEIRWDPTSMRRSIAFTAMPAFERWNQAGRAWHDNTPGRDLSLERLNQTMLTRISRAFQFRDSVFALSASMVDAEPEEMLCDLDSLLFSLVGAFDIAAIIADLVLGLGSKPQRIGWQKTGNKEWQKKLEPVAKDLYDYTAPGTEMQHVFQVLRWLRNSVHNEALNLTRDNRQFYVTLDAHTQDALREFLHARHTRWTVADLGIRVQPPGGATAGKWLEGTGRASYTVRNANAPKLADPLDGQLVVDVRDFVNRVFPASLQCLDQIMRLTPMSRAPGCSAALDNPSRANLPWHYSDTTGHRLRFLYGITEIP